MSNTNYYSNVNFDYPNCGGVEVKKGRKFWTITVLSNFSGNRTGVVYRTALLAQKSTTAQEIAEKYNNDSLQYLVTVNRGIVVR